MDEETAEDMQAQIAALRLITTALFTRWAQANEPESPDEAYGSAFRMIEGMIASMHANASDASPSSLAIFQRIEEHLRFILRNVGIRLKAKMD